MKKEVFIERFETAIRETYIDNIGVYVMIGDATEPEIIVNPRANFESKLQYYKDAYDDDMCLKYNKEIKIVDIQVQVLRIYPDEFKPKQVPKDLSITEVRGAKDNISDLVVYGDGDTFRLLCKASSQSQGWMKSTKVCNLYEGCIVQVTTQQRNPDGSYAVAEALTYVPDVNLDTTCEPRELRSLKFLR